MLLEQITRRLDQLVADQPQRKPRAVPSTANRETPLPGTTKTIGVQVDAETYAKLVELQKRLGLKSVKAAALEAIKRGA